MKRITKKQQEINAVMFDIEAMREGIAEIEKTKKFQFMYQGTLYTKFAATRLIAESEAYLKTLKP